jgi:hypothetical protein
VAAALFCERVLQEGDGVLSAIRIVDQQVLHLIGANVPGDMPPAMLNTTLLIALKAGQTRGRYAVRIAPEAPSGEGMPPVDFAVNFMGGDGEQGINLVVPMQMQVAQEGLYWFDVVWVDPKVDPEAGALLTRVPLRVVYQPVATS